MKHLDGVTEKEYWFLNRTLRLLDRVMDIAKGAQPKLGGLHLLSLVL